MKKYFLFLAVVALSVGVFAFTTAAKEKPLPQMQQWYDFTGDDPNDPGDYQPHVGPPPTCTEGSTRCAVKALPLAGTPSQPNLNDPNIDIRNYTP